ncbi:hypothetical protein GUJ93_ZPchr0006g43182 [Zizania palustris]|uniref:Uncharacterized protein n=1 Tax=Zizania palustris TaxID=103762 RepID=A0A8J5T443_ZIZPA|nr:hypothetical protein GUJ93_ZPchr0006g43182 [Zizania palustris]
MLGCGAGRPAGRLLATERLITKAMSVHTPPPLARPTAVIEDDDDDDAVAHTDPRRRRTTNPPLANSEVLRASEIDDTVDTNATCHCESIKAFKLAHPAAVECGYTYMLHQYQ